MSSGEKAVAFRFTERYLGSFSVAFLPSPHRSIWRRPLLWSHSGQPIKQPWLYQNPAWPLWQSPGLVPVMLVQSLLEAQSLGVLTPTCGPAWRENAGLCTATEQLGDHGAARESELTR